jgi:hypothetical protein
VKTLLHLENNGSSARTINSHTCCVVIVEKEIYSKMFDDHCKQ